MSGEHLRAPYGGLRQCIDRLPLILAGPMLRRTESNAVTVWVALKEPCDVTLRVYSTRLGNGSSIDEQLLEGSASTVQLGKNLHAIALTAQPLNHLSNGGILNPGQIYAYDLNFNGCNLAQALNSEGFLPQVKISYFPHQLPTFVMPADDLNQLKIVHGSCRKPHGGGPDALAILDALIEQSANHPYARPQQLFLTGDQIYGDDVADPLLWFLTDAGNTLLGWEENLPLQKHPTSGYEFKKPNEMKPGTRSNIAEEYGGFTAMLGNKPEKAKSHLFSLGEYYAMYLFAWSPVLWSNSFPLGKDMGIEGQQAKQWDRDVRILQDLATDLWQIRRSLANIPTYTIFDDHDISDDWYLNREWCNRVLSKPFGRRVVQNGLLACAVFQAWGNTPEQFLSTQPGATLLQAAQNWSLSAGTDLVAYSEISKLVGLPPTEPETYLPKLKLDRDVLILDRDYPDETITLNWHYSLRSFKHEVIVLDTRTWRGYPVGENCATDPPMLLSPTGFKEQIQKPLELSDRLNESGSSHIELTFVVIPTNLESLSIIDFIQELSLSRGKVFQHDVGDSWNLNLVGFSRLLATLFQRRDRIVVLTGDIHYGAAVRLNYWSRRHFEDQTPDTETFQSAHLLAQLTSSALKNAEFTTHLVHTKAKSIALEQPEDWAGWNKLPQLIEIQIIQEMVRWVEVKIESLPIIRQLHGMSGKGEIYWEIAVKNRQSLPDWQYHIEWVERERAKVVSWSNKQVSSPIAPKKSWENILSWIWQNSWFQEGKEVVGYSNLGVVTINWSEHNDAKAVIQDIYWRLPWEPSRLVYSRYIVSLRLDEPPRLPRVISPES